DEILDQPADRVIGERGDDAGAQSEAAAQTPRDVVLASALPRVEGTGGRDATVARIEAEHHLPERNEVVTALGARTKIDHAAVSTAARARRVISSKRPSRTSAVSQIQLPPQASTEGTARYAGSEP